ncbi:hypothetical protein JJD41_07815 [Oxynema sp. CENA135]|nr:hypothetical protein [Oxynema sp. CENA135]MBK4729776.1 hypothetical protein [Oxynema sp. CENA135]
MNSPSICPIRLAGDRRNRYPLQPQSRAIDRTAPVEIAPARRELASAAEA